jgi:hypothetical protein
MQNSIHVIRGPNRYEKKVSNEDLHCCAELTQAIQQARYLASLTCTGRLSEE